MDFMPLPQNPTHQIPEIRLFSNHGYDNLGFATYPDRQGWPKRTRREWVELFEEPPPEFVAFLERWLFFSIAQALLLADASSFIKYTGSPSYPVLTLDRLPALLTQLRGYSILSKNDQVFFFFRIHTALTLSSWEKNTGVKLSDTPDLLMFIEEEATVDPRRPIMTMVTSFLTEIIMAAAKNYKIKNGLEYFTGDHILVTTPVFSWSGPFWRLLRDDGWCPSHLKFIFARSGASSLWFLHHLTRPSSYQEHPVIRIRDCSNRQSSSLAENLCTISCCRYRRFDDNTYKTMHTDDCDGSCDNMVVRPENLCSILKERKIPLIVASHGGSRKPNILLRAADPDDVYIAISHVWSDGLGNPRQNALPSCQFLRISRMIHSYQKTVYFWLDTLCVPPDEMKLKNEQTTALELMRETYEKAKAVLVLDSWILEQMCDGKSDVENLHKIFFCTWNTRLWTFQEGALAQTLLFQFQDGIYDVDQAIQRVKNNKDISIEVTVKPRLVALHDELREFRKYDKPINDLLKFIAPSMATRTTSVSADEPLCLAALLNLDVKRITETKNELRMQEFWKMLESVPAALLFSSPYTRMNVNGLRWAPQSLLGMTFPVDLYGPEVLPRTENGLLVTCPSLRFRAEDKDIPESIRLTDGNGNWYLVRMILQNCHESKEFQYPGTKDRGIFINIKKAYDCDEVGFIFSNQLRSQDSDDLVSYRHDMIVMIAIKHEEGGRIYSKFICVGTFEQYGLDTYEGDKLQDIFQRDMIKHLPINTSDLEFRPDNVELNVEAGNINWGELEELAQRGVVIMISDRRSEKIICWVCKEWTKRQDWCIG